MEFKNSAGNLTDPSNIEFTEVYVTAGLEIMAIKMSFTFGALSLWGEGGDKIARCISQSLLTNFVPKLGQM